MRKYFLCLYCLVAAFIPGRGAGIVLSLGESFRTEEAVERLLRDYALLPGWERPVHGVLPVVSALGTSHSGAFLKMLGRDPRIVHAEPDYTVQAAGMPNDPLFNKQWSLFNPDHARADIQAPEAWKVTTGSQKIIIAIIDSGIEYHHPDLAGNMWRNPGEIPGNGIDDDGNGYADDVHGWNFVNDDANPIDKFYHGTMMSGVLGAVTNNHIGIAGLMQRVSLMAVKGLTDNGWGYNSDLIAGIYYAVDNGARLINASWGGGNAQKAMTDAIAYAAAHNVVVVAAAGNWAMDNDLNPFYPSSYDNDNIVAVGASDKFDGVAGFSHVGRRTVDLFAPGVDVLSTTLRADYHFDSGTSISVPYVAGALGLLMLMAPGAAYGDYIRLLHESVRRLPGMKDKCTSGGRLDAAQILALRHKIFPRVGTSRTFRGVLSILTQITAN